jgi:hypothetical protein
VCPIKDLIVYVLYRRQNLLWNHLSIRTYLTFRKAESRLNCRVVEILFHMNWQIGEFHFVVGGKIYIINYLGETQAFIKYRSFGTYCNQSFEKRKQSKYIKLDISSASKVLIICKYVTFVTLDIYIVTPKTIQCYNILIIIIMCLHWDKLYICIYMYVQKFPSFHD